MNRGTIVSNIVLMEIIRYGDSTVGRYNTWVGGPLRM